MGVLRDINKIFNNTDDKCLCHLCPAKCVNCKLDYVFINDIRRQRPAGCVCVKCTKSSCINKRKVGD